MNQEEMDAMRKQLGISSEEKVKPGAKIEKEEEDEELDDEMLDSLMAEFNHDVGVEVSKEEIESMMAEEHTV